MKTLALTTIKSVQEVRIETKVKTFDSFIGGGFINGQAIFIAGQPGVGKSTLLLQLAAILVDQAQRVLYVSGEESLEQLKLRADRLNVLRDSIYCSDGIELEQLYKTLHQLNPKFVIIDSLQMVTSTEIKGEPGSSRQMKHCMLSLIKHAKDTGRILIIIGHSTKTGLVAGLLTLQHMVDTVLFITKDDTGNARYIIAKKNRFGNIDEVFTMHMEEEGFKEFTTQLVKGTQVVPNILPYLQHKYGDEVRFDKKVFEDQFNNGFFKSLYKALFAVVERKLFGELIYRDYEVVFKLKDPTIDNHDNL